MGDGRGTRRRAQEYDLAGGLLASIRLALPTDTAIFTGNRDSISAALEQALTEPELEAFRTHFTLVDGRTGRYATEIPKILHAGIAHLQLLETTDTDQGKTNYHFKITHEGARTYLRASTTNTGLPNSKQFERLGRKLYEHLEKEV